MKARNFSRATRSHTLASATDDTATLLAALRKLLADCRGLIAERGITLIGVALANLDDADAIQLELPFQTRDLTGLDAALDRVRDRYGSAAITRG